MLRFAVFNEEGLAAAWPLRHAYAFGPDDIPIQADIVFEDGHVRVVKSNPEPAGLALQVDLDRDLPEGVGPLGQLTLRTCLLPDRDEPYLLMLELARRRIMAFLNRLEDWGLFDLPASDPVMERFEASRAAFTRALVTQRAGGNGLNAEAARLARRALAVAVDAGERLTVRDAEIDLPVRVRGEMYRRAAEHYERVHEETPPPDTPIITPLSTGVTLPTRPMVGSAVNPNRMTEAAQRAAGESCDFISLPMRWSDLEPNEGHYTFTGTDRWIEWAYRVAKMPVFAGPVVDFRPSSTPEWLYIWENDYETLRELVYEHVKAVVTRYRRTIRRWTVASGLHVNEGFRLTFDQMVDLTRIAVLVTRKLHPQAKIQIEITQPWGEYYAANRKALPPLVYADTLSQAGVKVDAIALRLQMGQASAGQSVRDLMAISSLLDRFAQFERAVSVTGLGAPSAPAGEEAGAWRGAWSPERQADWAQNVLAICLSKPYVHSVCWQELTDADSVEMPYGGLLDANDRPKPALGKLAQFRAALRAGRSPLASAAAT